MRARSTARGAATAVRGTTWFTELLGDFALAFAVSGSRSADWQGVFRLNAERELTQRALAARRGAPPKPASSACIDGGWEYVPAKRGVTIRYKGAMQPTPKDAIDYPLEVTVAPVARRRPAGWSAAGSAAVN